MSSKSQATGGLGQTTEVAVIHKTVQPIEEFEKAKLSKENPTSNMPKSEGALELDKSDWLRWVRQVTHDETLTLQQKDRELDRIVNAMIERKNQRTHGGLKADRRIE
ncbi:hypothetical protein TcWFU_009056 [Taenia crassiceps]|uniref:Uncharacterized protein n=1 Tax=Taenia crassiceps TaxID=6207 RepID=A0ABR4QHY6_9CEST